MLKINFTKEFTKLYRKADPKIRNAVAKRLELFSQNPFNPNLNNHPLTGNYQGYRSININGDWRAVYSESKMKNGVTIITFKFLGTHSKSYK